MELTRNGIHLADLANIKNGIDHIVCQMYSSVVFAGNYNKNEKMKQGYRDIREILDQSIKSFIENIEKIKDTDDDE
jgi:hypothetical protein